MHKAGGDQAIALQGMPHHHRIKQKLMADRFMIKSIPGDQNGNPYNKIGNGHNTAIFFDEL
ncbi:hypothetical protein D9M68_829680 [compost metagenome]